MSSKMLYRWLLRTKSAPSFLRSTGPGPVSAGFTWNMNTIRFPAQRGGAAVLQQRHFHQTCSCKLASGLEITGTLAACSILGVGIVGVGINVLYRAITGGTLPPHIWARTVDQQTRDEVETTVAVGFNMARNSAPHQRNDALRQATFEVPCELARLNKDAPDFWLEDLGPMVQARNMWDTLGRALPRFAPFIDCAEEMRVLLYFPNQGAAKATAVFVAVNSELKGMIHGPQRSTEGSTAAYEADAGIEAGIEACLVAVAWMFQHEAWLESHPAVTDRIEKMERLPIIFNFREKAFGAMYYTRIRFMDPTMFLTPLTIMQLD